MAAPARRPGAAAAGARRRLGHVAGAGAGLGGAGRAGQLAGDRPGGTAADPPRGGPARRPGPAAARQARAAAGRGRRPRRLALLTLLRLLDVGFGASLGRPFDPLYDWGYAGSAVGLLRDSVGGAPRARCSPAWCLLASSCWSRVPAAVLRVSAWPGGTPVAPPARCRRRRGVGAVRGPRAAGVPGAPVASTEPGGPGLRPGRAGACVATRAAGVHRRADRRPAGRRARRATCSRAARPRRAGGLRRELRPGRAWRTRTSPGRAPGADPRHRALQRGRLPRPQRFLTSPTFGGAELAGPLHPPVRAAGGPPAALRRAARQPAADAGLRLRAGGLAHRRRRARPTRHLARGRPLLRLATDLRRPRPRVRRARVRLRDDARPVHPPRSAPRARRPATAPR